MTTRLFDLAHKSAPIFETTPGEAVYERFQSEPDTLAIAVVDGDETPVGMVERNAFFLAMAAPYGRALYARRGVALLMNPAPLVVDGGLSVAQFCGETLAERPSELLKGFIVVRQGRYVGVGTALELLQATNAASRAHAEEMTRLAETLNRAKTEAQAALTAKSQFLAVMSHEIRTPLNGVLAIADILARKLAQPELRPYVSGIQESGRTLLRLLTDALDLSRADAGRLELEEEAFCAPRLLDDLAALWTARAEMKGLQLSFRYDGPEDQWALGDAVRIKQVFNNLIGNALKFTRVGGVQVDLGLRREGQSLRLGGAVCDSGVGAPPDRLQSIFQPFSQTEAGVREGGAGLGLAICRQLVERMGGTIAARPNSPHGLVVEFGFPIAEISPAPSELSPDPAELDGLGLHVLIADDNPTNRLVAQTLCEMFGCTSEAVEDGLQAVEAAERGTFDLVLMDIKMPNLDGVGATARIRALPGPAGQIPILALTANADPMDAAHYLAQGMDGVVDKPVKPERLFDAIVGLGQPVGTDAAAA